MQLLIVSGMSGAGKSRAATVLEDLGFYCIDNLPAPLIPKIAEIGIAATEQYDHVALISDVRQGKDFGHLFTSIMAVRDMGIDCRILFLDTDTPVLINRFKETRRKHPLMREGISMQQAIEKERQLLEGVRDKADFVVNTTRLSPTALRDRLVSLFAQETEHQTMSILVQSFGFKNGAPTDADVMLDVRFLPNPYYIPALREHNGTEREVHDYVFQNGTADVLMTHLKSLADFLVPQYTAEGKAQLTIAIGCTGGKHRSVAIAEALGDYLRSCQYQLSAVSHRDCAAANVKIRE